MVKVWRPHYQESKEVINMEKNEVNHKAHSAWRCQYHIVFAPKFRRKVIYGELKADIGQIIRKLCEEKKVEIIEAEACPDHIHMLVSIPPHLSVAQFMGFLKGKSTLMIFDRHANLKYFNNFRGNNLSVGHALHTDIYSTLRLRKPATIQIVIFCSCNC